MKLTYIKHFALAAVMATLCLALGACAQGQGDDSTEATEQPAQVQEEQAQPQDAQEERTVLAEANGETLVITLESNSSASALADLLASGPFTVPMHDCNDFEKVGPLPASLPTNDQQISTVPGDVILYQGNQITIYYGENSWNFTKLGHIEGATAEGLLAVLGDGDVDVTFSLAN